MLLTYKLLYPITDVMDMIVEMLNTKSTIKASGEFITDTPEHCIITIEVSNESTHQDVLAIGAVIGYIEMANRRSTN